MAKYSCQIEAGKGELLCGQACSVCDHRGR